MRDVCTAILPFHTLEHIDEPRVEKEGGTGVSPVYQPQLFDFPARQTVFSIRLHSMTAIYPTEFVRRYATPCFCSPDTRAEARAHGRLPLTRQPDDLPRAAIAAPDHSPAIHRRDLTKNKSSVA